MLPDVLHSLRSLLCTSTNMTPLKRMFTFPWKSSFGESIPSWLSNPDLVLLRRHNRQSKFDPYIEEVELLEANPSYAHIKYYNDRETTVSLRDLALCAEPIKKHFTEYSQSVPEAESALQEQSCKPTELNQAERPSRDQSVTKSPPASDGKVKDQECLEQNIIRLPRSTRERRAPERYSNMT